MLASFEKVIKRTSSLGIIILFLLLAFTILFLPWQFIPDYFKLGVVTGKRDTVFKLLSIIVGSSSLMLTLLLVGFNFYVKTTRRFTLEFVTANRWLRFIISVFFGIVLFLAVGFFFLETGHASNNTTFLYIAYIVTILFLLSLFPMAVLALNESYSIDRIYKILNSISDDDINDLYKLQFNKVLKLDQIEKHPILILKDLCISAIADKDWVLPQTVLGGLYERLIMPLKRESNEIDIQRSTFVWALFCNHLKRDVIKHNDVATGKSLYVFSLYVHEHFAQHGIIHVRGNSVDDFLKDYLRMMIEHNAFNEIHSYFSRDITNIMKGYYQTMHYTDDQIPTLEYRMEGRNKAADEPPKDTSLADFWFYLNKVLPSILFDTLELAIDVRRKSIYEPAFWNIQSTMDVIFKAQGLTVSQKRNAIKEFLYDSRKLSDYAIAHQIYDNIEPVSDLQVYTWFETDTYTAYDAFFSYKHMINALSDTNAGLHGAMDRFFMIGRALSGSSLEKNVLNEVIGAILQLAIAMLKKETLSSSTRQAILFQLKWFQKDYLNPDVAMLPTKEKYNDEISDFLERFADQIPAYG